MCLHMAAEKAGIPYFEGCLGKIRILDSMLYIGFKRSGYYSKVDYAKVAYQYLCFGAYARCFVLPHVLLQAVASHLLRPKGQ